MYLLLLVGVIWGVTNPFLEEGVKGKQEDLSWKSFLKTILNFRFILPFGVNQLGSLLYYYGLGQY